MVMRLDRVVTLLAYRAARSLASNRADAQLPILMYHSISATNEQGSPYYRTATHPAVFAEHMRLLENEGYTGVTLSQGLEALQSSNLQRGIRQPVAITFDDGYRDFLTAAVPVLDRHGFKASMYLPTGFISRLRARFKGRDCLTWSEVRTLHEAGFEIGSHTVTHPRLTELTWNEIKTELIVSKRTIERQLGAEVTAFSYPYAFPKRNREFTQRFSGFLHAAGYCTAVTTLIGRVGVHDDALRLKRLPVNSCDDPDLLRAKLQGFYDWMASPQSAAKQFKRQ